MRWRAGDSPLEIAGIASVLRLPCPDFFPGIYRHSFLALIIMWMRSTEHPNLSQREKRIFQRLKAHSTAQHDSFSVSRRCQRQAAFGPGDRSLRGELQVGSRESGIADRSPNRCRTEALTICSSQECRCCFKINLCVTDAIQAPEGSFSPLSSERSRHPFDGQVDPFDLRQRGHGNKEHHGNYGDGSKKLPHVLPPIRTTNETPQCHLRWALPAGR